MTDEWDNYFYEGTNVLKNKFGIKDQKKLEEQEKVITLRKLTELELLPITGKFNLERLKKIHKYLFNDIYYFAGEFRRSTMAKTTRQFYDPEYIKDELEKTLNILNENVNDVYDKRKYSYVLAKAYYDLMSIHPFREGNGRSVREYLRELVLYKNKDLPFKVKLDFSKMNSDLFLKAVEYRYVYPSLLEDEFYKALTPLEKGLQK